MILFHYRVFIIRYLFEYTDVYCDLRLRPLNFELAGRKEPLAAQSVVTAVHWWKVSDRRRVVNKGGDEDDGRETKAGRSAGGGNRSGWSGMKEG